MKRARAALGVDYEGTLDKPNGVGWEREEEIYEVPLSEETAAAMKAWKRS
jgi:hypothetical protein